jgi:hypothetical protein
MRHRNRNELLSFRWQCALCEYLAAECLERFFGLRRKGPALLGKFARRRRVQIIGHSTLLVLSEGGTRHGTSARDQYN